MSTAVIKVDMLLQLYLDGILLEPGGEFCQ